ncbi:hypothetical protein DXG01_014195 [Tephrocybe rancida]|nr:hypothetical protein DXG01_014195 [Tephrocybe rancida]
MKYTPKTTQKVAENNKENLKKANLETAKLKKQMTKLKTQKADEDNDNDKTDNDLESQDDEDMGFLSLITLLIIALPPWLCQHPHNKDQNPRTARLGSDSDEDDINQQICDTFNRKANSPDPVAADDGDLADNHTNQAGALMIPLLSPDVKLSSAPTINDFANPVKPAMKEGFYENSVILSVLMATVFKDLTAAGVVYEEMFNPISLHTLALVLTLVDFCISEWLTGKFKQGVFSESNVKEAYNVYLANLTEWHHMNPEVMTNCCKKLYRV